MNDPNNLNKEFREDKKNEQVATSIRLTQSFKSNSIKWDCVQKKNFEDSLAFAIKIKMYRSFGLSISPLEICLQKY